MIPITAKQLIDYIDQDKINTSAKKFIKSIVKERINKDMVLTPDQSRVLQKIYRESQASDYEGREFV